MERNGLYATIWRWHFFAGLMTLPFLVLLAVTGGLYLFKDEIDDWRYNAVLNVVPSDGPGLAPSAIVARAEAIVAGKPTGYVPPATPEKSARVILEDESGETRFVFVDPGDGKVLGEFTRDGFGNLPLMSFVRRLHSLEVAGWPGNRLIEIVAGWAVILAISGAYLWWPRGRRGGVISVRRKAGNRTFWRDIHAVTGAFAGLLIVFMALTGMPWSGVWGESVKELMYRSGLGYPSGFWFPTAKSTPPMGDVQAPLAWSFDRIPMSASAPGSEPIGLDAAVARFETAGMAAGYSISFPKGPEGVWAASAIPDDVSGIRAMHLDQYSGATLFDARYADLGAGARLIEWGISVHTGQQYGRANQFLMLAVCVAIVLMSAAAVFMWWARRPSGSLGAPRAPGGYRVQAGLIAIVLFLGLVFPLVGLSILACLAVDAVLAARWRSLKLSRPS